MGFCSEFSIVSIEDPFEQDDWAAWTGITSVTKIQIVDDDLLVGLILKGSRRQSKRELVMLFS